jgi:hypothetical protein
MDPVQRIMGAAQIITGQARGGPRGFAVPADRAATPAAAPAAPAVVLGGLLALQEAEEEPPRDRAARRRGRDLLAALAALQRDLLGAGPTPEALERLAALAAGVPVAGDVALREAVAAIAVRAQVELARYGRA